MQGYLWSSYGEYLQARGRRPSWLRVDRLLGEKGIPGDTEAGRQQFASRMERRRGEESSADCEKLRREWILGSEQFRQELLAAVAGQVGPSHYGAPRQETSVQKAERILQQELKRLGWQEQELRARRKGDLHKVSLARLLRQQTTMSLKWIAQRLEMGSWTYVSNLLHPKPPSRKLEATLPLFQ